MKVVVAIDSFKGSLSSLEAGEAAAVGVRRAIPDADCVVRPLADGGEGTVDALVGGMGGEFREVRVTGPAGRPVVARYGLLPGGTAVMEMAQAAGITLVSDEERNPCTTTTFGVGEMVLDAVAHGATRIVMGIGGSATNDAGAGMLQALGFRLLGADGADLPRGGAALAGLSRIVRPELPPLSFRIACDVANPLCGPNGASAVFGPQKGATPGMVAELDAALAHFASVAGGEPDSPGAGAAGGLGYAFSAFLGAELVPGVELVLQETRLSDDLRGADVVVTGEGRLDGQTVMGKAPIGVARLAKGFGARVLAFSGCVGDGVEAVNEAGVDAYFPILRRVTTLAEALDRKTASANLSATVEQAFRLLRRPLAALALLAALVTAPTASAEPAYAFRRQLETVHRSGLRDPARKCAEGECELRDGVAIRLPQGGGDLVRRAAADFADYLAVSMHVDGDVWQPGRAGNPVQAVELVLDSSLRPREYRVETGEGVRLSAADERALAQALYHLEDVMNLREGPFLPRGDTRRRPLLEVRMSQSGYGFVEFPDEHLEQMAHAGINAIIVPLQGLDRPNAHPYMDVAALIRRAARHGLDTYLYCEFTPFVHPADPGGMEKFRESFGRILGGYPEAKGSIFVGESCQFPSKDPRVQPVLARNRNADDKRPPAGWFPCSDYPEWLEAVKTVVHERAPKMEIVFWTYNWGWAPEPVRLALIDSLPKDVTLEATFEMFERRMLRNGIDTPTADYSISFAGPGAYFVSEAERARRNSLRLFAQANTGGRTWDFGTVPYQPVPFQWARRWRAVAGAVEKWGLCGVMENHHYGWWPGFLAELEKEALTEGGMPFEEHLRLVAARDFGAANADEAIDVWRRWSDDAVDYVPTDMNQYGTFRNGPAYPFTFGKTLPVREEFPCPHHTEVHPFAFVRVDYLQEGYVQQLTKERMDNEYLAKEIELFEPMAKHYDEGASKFAAMAGSLSGRRRDAALEMVSLGRYLAAVCRTAVNLKRGAIAYRNGDAAGLLAAARAEYANAAGALKLVEADSRLGWEPCMGYSGGPDQIRWKLSRMERDYGAENLR